MFVKWLKAWEWWQGDPWPQVATKNYWTEGEPLAPRSYQLMIALVLSSPKTQNSFQPSRREIDINNDKHPCIKYKKNHPLKIRWKTLLSIIWLATETNWGKRGVGAEDAKGNFVIFQTTRCAALNPLSWSPMHHLPSSNLSIRIKTTDLVTNNISSNWKTVNISVQAENMHKAWNRENVRGEKTWDAFLQDQASCPWSDKSQLGSNFKEFASIYVYHLNSRLSRVRWPKKWSLRNPKWNEQWNVQPWSLLISPCLISILYRRKIFSKHVSLVRRIVWCDFQLTSSLP